jgi:hypothetical protein
VAPIRFPVITINRGSIMQKNVGSADKVVRIVIGLGLLGFALLSESPARWWGLVGVVPLLTAAMGNCPLYSILGMSTCPVSARK